MEIIKQSFLNHLNKKVFVILCIHEDEPFLEIYTKKVQATTHTPTQVLDLKKCNYVGLKIPVRSLGQQETFEFVISLENCDVVTFAAKTWNLMIEWVNCLKLKLRELKILSPKENIYTKPPGMKPAIIQSTRNPRDPLPQRPMNVSDIPGLELTERVDNNSNHNGNTREQVVVNSENEATQQVENILDVLAINDADDDDTTADPITIPIFNFSTSNTTSQNLINLLSNPLRHTTNTLNYAAAFQDLFNVEPDDDEDDDDDINEKENNEDVPPTSVDIDYIPEVNVEAQSVPRDNITVIKIAENEMISSQAHRKENNPRVTKIKIEMDYDQLSNATSLMHSHVMSSSLQSQLPKPIETQSQSQAPSTSTSVVNCENGVGVSGEVKQMIKVKETEKIVVQGSPKKSAPATPKHHEKRKLSLREKQVQQLRNEINTEIRFKLRKKDCVDSIAFVSAFGSVWIAGFKPNPVLYCLHVGDQLLAINNIVIKSPSDAQKYIKMCSGLFVEVTIRRLPLAGIFLIKREFEGQCLGIIRDGSSSAIVEIIPNSISSHIPPRPISQDEDSTWIITQINFRNLSLISHKKYDEIELLLNSSSLEMSLLLQPSDFIAKIKKELKAMKNYRDYTLQ
ncbi:CLUMA_CG000743, isoform A [Clunio marinus]|uniref:CLUMA_CG000743, isoform A n=1 Tax=Clunio marinus TaxID=568069 RepID=A0A1J1HH88_9DIPT|nr:CLUMA_CG000743, isoform A [Clunio marinus]